MPALAQEDAVSPETVAAYARARPARALLDLATAVPPYLALSFLMYVALDGSYLLVLALAIPAAGFLLRTFILFHDCVHGSFLTTKRANRRLGIALGLLVYQPYLSWKHGHAVHHATAGGLDRRGVGDVATLRSRSTERRLDYVSQASFRVARPARVRVTLVDKDGWTALATSAVVTLGHMAGTHSMPGMSMHH